MKEITLFNNSSSQMTVMALGKAISWNPKTTLNVYESEANALLKYEHVCKFEDLKTDNVNSILEEENKSLKEELAKLKEEVESLKEKPKKSK